MGRRSVEQGTLPYIPNQMDIMYVDLTGAVGKEIHKRRPVLVLSQTSFNSATGFCVVCPISHRSREYPSVLPIQDTSKIIQGAVLTHQIKSVDYQAREARYVEKVDPLTWIHVVDITKDIF
jgi:mRNA interferase MazF